MVIGFMVVICGAFSFFNLDNNEYLNLHFKLISENSIKFILIILMGISLLIRPISSPRTVILWQKIGILNYFRAYIFIIGCAFLPGLSIFNIFLQDNKLHEKFKVEPFFIKFTLSPILSFSFLGLSVLILDQIGLSNINLFILILFILIVFLYISELIILRIRREKINIFIEKIYISKHTIIISIISFGVMLIALGVHFGASYLIPGDSWAGLSSTNYIGNSKLSPIEYGQANLYYPIFWGYVIYGLSVLGGLPFINMNALLAPFCYLYVFSIYLLIYRISPS